MNSPSREIFPVKLKEYMERDRINQKDLADELGVSKSTVHCWLTGKAFPRIDIIQRMAIKFRCKTSDLIIPKTDTQPRILMAFDSAPQQGLNEDDEELVELWSHASDTAKQAALAVLKAMEGK